jgi:hypothetical protein
MDKAQNKEVSNIISSPKMKQTTRKHSSHSLTASIKFKTPNKDNQSD